MNDLMNQQEGADRQGRARPMRRAVAARRQPCRRYATYRMRAVRVYRGMARHAGPAVALTAGVTLVAATALATLTPPQADAAANPTLGPCDTGQLCLWQEPDFKGPRTTYELSATGTGSCVAVPKGTTAESLANRMGRPVTTYQSAECAETGEFETYPGDGVWLPQSTYQIRAFKVWEH